MQCEFKSNQISVAAKSRSFQVCTLAGSIRIQALNAASETLTGERPMKCLALSATIAVGLCLVSLPAVALLSVGERPSIFERRSLPQWPNELLAASPLDRGLPIMMLGWVGLLPPETLLALASVAVHGNRTPAALGARRSVVSSMRRVSAHRAVYARFKIPSRLPLQLNDTPVFIGGLY
jgi:hypothetical protein